MKTLQTWAAAAAMVALTGAAQAALVPQGNGTVLDTNTNLIWLQNWNVKVIQNWATQMAWAEGLTFAGSSDWVLPSISDYTTLFSEVGNLIHVSAFENVRHELFYWSGTEISPGLSAWSFNAVTGLDFGRGELILLFAVAVRPGDVVAAVPEPQTLALALLALGATVVARRRRPH